MLNALVFKAFLKGRAVQKLPVKNVLMKRKKIQSSSSSSKPIQSTKNLFEHVLFKQDKERIKAYKKLKSNADIRSQQKQTQENWTLFTTQRQLKEYFYEQKLSKSKINALKELESFPRLYEQAKIIDYELPPVSRRPLALLPPWPNNFYFTQ